MLNIFPELDLDVLIASVRNEKRINHIFEKYKFDIVFHAAAHKHVPLMEKALMNLLRIMYLEHIM